MINKNKSNNDDLDTYYYSKYNIKYSNLVVFLYISSFSLIFIVISLESFIHVFRDDITSILIFILFLPFVFKNCLNRMFDTHYKKLLSSGFIALIDFFSFVDSERNLFKVCEFISQSDYYLISDVFKQAIKESQISYLSLKEVLIDSFEQNLFGEIRKYWLRTLDLWDKDPIVINSFINSLSNRIDEQFREEIKAAENLSSVFIALGSLLPPSLILLLMISGQINILTIIILSITLVCFAFIFSPYSRSKRIFNDNIVIENSLIQGSELATLISEELIKGHNFRKALIVVVNSIESYNSQSKLFLMNYKRDLILGKVIDDNLCFYLGKTLCEFPGSTILQITNKLIKLSPKAAIKFLENYSISLIKQESYYSERKSLFISEKIRLFTALIFSTLTLGFSASIAPLFHFVSMFSSNFNDGFSNYDWKNVIQENTYFFEFFLVFIASTMYLFGYEDLKLKNILKKEFLKNLSPFFVLLFLFIISATIGQKIVKI